MGKLPYAHHYSNEETLPVSVNDYLCNRFQRSAWNLCPSIIRHSLCFARKAQFVGSKPVMCSDIARANIISSIAISSLDGSDPRVFSLSQSFWTSPSRTSSLRALRYGPLLEETHGLLSLDDDGISKVDQRFLDCVPINNTYSLPGIHGPYSPHTPSPDRSGALSLPPCLLSLLPRGSDPATSGTILPRARV
jgi:hypothetical protein